MHCMKSAEYGGLYAKFFGQTKVVSEFSITQMADVISMRISAMRANGHMRSHLYQLLCSISSSSSVGLDEQGMFAIAQRRTE